MAMIPKLRTRSATRRIIVGVRGCPVTATGSRMPAVTDRLGRIGSEYGSPGGGGSEKDGWMLGGDNLTRSGVVVAGRGVAGGCYLGLGVAMLWAWLKLTKPMPSPHSVCNVYETGTIAML